MSRYTETELIAEIRRPHGHARKICMSAKEALYAGTKDDLEVADMLEAAFSPPNALTRTCYPKAYCCNCASGLLLAAGWVRRHW